MTTDEKIDYIYNTLKNMEKMIKYYSENKSHTKICTICGSIFTVQKHENTDICKRCNNW